jgi:DNA-binding transcriptional MerR regulator
MFTIGRFAALSGVSAKTLRAWDDAGLFRPAWVDGPSGYRYYSPAQLPDLRRVVALRDLGMGLAEIGSLAAGGNLDEALRRRRSELVRERADIDRRLGALGIAIGAGGPSARGGPVPPVSGADEGARDVVVRDVAPQIVATRAVDLAGGDAEAAFDELEAHVRDLRRRAHRPPGMVLGGDAGGDLGDDVDGDADTVYVPLTRPVPATERIGCTRLPAERMATVIHRGPYGGLSAALAGLDRWISAAGLRATGRRRLVYLQFGADLRLRLPTGYVVEDAASYLTELQVPVVAAP